MSHRVHAEVSAELIFLYGMAQDSVSCVGECLSGLWDCEGGTRIQPHHKDRAEIEEIEEQLEQVKSIWVTNGKIGMGAEALYYLHHHHHPTHTHPTHTHTQTHHHHHLDNAQIDTTLKQSDSTLCSIHFLDCGDWNCVFFLDNMDERQRLELLSMAWGRIP